ncbi:MAG: hypothetical protein DYH03_13960 [Nitrospira sp. NTP1]|nr:hypothetical protein [Nitrospira sp. NTP1]
MVEILVVDDNLQLRDTLRTILNKRPGFCVTGEAADGIAASQLEVEVAMRAVGAHAFLPKELVPEKIFDVIAQQLPQEQAPQ